MCGYYEPQRVQVEVSVSAKRLFSQFETLSDEELLKLAEQEILDGDELITESGQGQEALEYSEGTEESPGETEDYTDFTEIESPKES
jgi:hypothetical protein